MLKANIHYIGNRSHKNQTQLKNSKIQKVKCAIIYIIWTVGHHDEGGD